MWEIGFGIIGVFVLLGVLVGLFVGWWFGVLDEVVVRLIDLLCVILACD